VPEGEDDISDISSTIPRFLTPEVPGKGMGMGMKVTSIVGKEDVVEARRMSTGGGGRTGEVYGGVESEQAGVEARLKTPGLDIRDDESDVLGETVSMDRTSGRHVAAVGYMSQQSLSGSSALRSLPSLAPAIWRMILFQTAFCAVQVLTCISTIADLARHRPSPTPLGTQHFALLLAAWGPAIVFGHSPAVRNSLRFWRRRAPVSS